MGRARRLSQIGAIGPVMGLAAILGPLLGALVTHADIAGLSWRAVFGVNLPLAAAALAAASLPRRQPETPPRPARLDGTGTGLAVLAAALIVYPLTQNGSTSWPALNWTAPWAGCSLLAVFGFQQRRRARAGRSPLVEVSLFRDRGFPAALAVSVLFSR